jgi:hypothetical protein
MDLKCKFACSSDKFKIEVFLGEKYIIGVIVAGIDD